MRDESDEETAEPVNGKVVKINPTRHIPPERLRLIQASPGYLDMFEYYEEKRILARQHQRQSAFDEALSTADCVEAVNAAQPNGTAATIAATLAAANAMTVAAAENNAIEIDDDDAAAADSAMPMHYGMSNSVEELNGIAICNSFPIYQLRASTTGNNLMWIMRRDAPANYNATLATLDSRMLCMLPDEQTCENIQISEHGVPAFAADAPVPDQQLRRRDLCLRQFAALHRHFYGLRRKKRRRNVVAAAV